MDNYLLTNNNGMSVRYSPKTCQLAVQTGHSDYTFSSTNPYVQVSAFGRSFKLQFPSAKRIHIEEINSTIGKSVRAVYSNFYANGKKLPFAIDTIVSLNNNDNFISFEFDVINCENDSIEKVVWPQAVCFDDNDGSAYTVVPSLQGALIPSKWHNTFMLYSGGRYYQRDCTMPWWGQRFGGGGYIAIAQTPWDGGFELKHSPSKKTRIAAAWYPSLRTMQYRRKCKFLFGDTLDYNEMCHIYREFVIESGKFVSLKEKAAKNPKLLNYIGVPLISDYLFVSIDESSLRYGSDADVFCISAYDRVKQLKFLNENGIKRACIHFDGCNRFGYDNGHPDIFPPNESIGGIDGIKFLISECHKMNYTLNFHDQYRDYYFNSPSFNAQYAIEDSENNLPKFSQNFGGNQSYLCMHNILPFIKRNYKLFENSGIAPDGVHLGSFSGDDIDECYNPLHPMTRKECVEKRIEAFDYLRSLNYVTSSDEPVDSIINSIDFVAHTPYSLTPSMGNGIGNGISVPLFNLVYHDALIMPWILKESRGGWWGIPSTDYSASHAFLNASPIGISMLELYTDETVKRIAPQINELCNLHKKLAFIPMTQHEFVDNNLRKQRTYFQDGTVLEVDFDTGNCRVL